MVMENSGFPKKKTGRMADLLHFVVLFFPR